jgi:hypothetical protein
MEIGEKDLHPHLKERMEQRGVNLNEINHVLQHGFEARDAKRGTQGKVFVFEYDDLWLGKKYLEKEVTVYFRKQNMGLIILTVKARYGKDFPRGEEN